MATVSRKLGFFAADVDAAGLALVRAQAEGDDLVDHFGEDGDQVAVAEAEHGVQVHRGAGFRQAGDDDPLDGFVLEQVQRQLADGLARRTLAHADQHHAVADRHDVAAFEGGVAMVLVRVAVPDLEVGVGELGVEFVDGAGQQGFLASRRPVHRVQRHAAIDPAGGVAGELGVGQRRQDEAGVAEEIAEHLDGLAAEAVRQVIGRHAADQELGDLARLQAAQPGADFIDQAEADLCWR